MSQSLEAKSELVAAIPRLRGFAFALCRNPDHADDLVQQTLLKAWANMHSFAPGSNMAAWLYTILRNEFYSAFRKRRHEVPDGDGAYAAKLASLPTQEQHLHFQDFRTALFKLADDHREALMLIGASGLSYEEAAALCGCAVGTMKSRVHRARNKLAALLNLEATEAISPDPNWLIAAPAVQPAGAGPSSDWS